MAPTTYRKTKNPKQNHHHNHNNNHRHQQPTTKPNKIDHHSQPQQITSDYHQYQLQPIKNHIKNHNIKNLNITFNYQYPSKIFFSKTQISITKKLKYENHIRLWSGTLNPTAPSYLPMLPPHTLPSSRALPPG